MVVAHGAGLTFKQSDVVELGVIRVGVFMKVQVILNPHVHLVLKFNGTWIKNIHHLAHLIDSCKDKYPVFEFEDNHLVVLEREVVAVSSYILKDYGIPAERSSNLFEPYMDSLGDN
ncbi:hypothetical protein VitviT2T_007196 [Vitis vinifera]|uniref:Protease Do-like PDZ domain-containing protein n=1 Tax=Vitis vinifera TaxID=29760 RepID=A0ABY9BYQ5_VITVI|nr:hypothetical protein VitviT2T_007196 [Vitis vinifera]